MSASDPKQTSDRASSHNPYVTPSAVIPAVHPCGATGPAAMRPATDTACSVEDAGHEPADLQESKLYWLCPGTTSR